MAFDVNRICRVCLEESPTLAFTSLFASDFGLAPSTMLMHCAKVQIENGDGMPPHVCDNCVYRLGVAYHFKQQCENSDLRLRQYLGLPYKPQMCTKDAAVNTETRVVPKPVEAEIKKLPMKKRIRKRTHKRKPEEEKLKRGPKPKLKQPQTCFECGKTFKCAAQLEMHIRTHTGERPFSCNYCPRRFAQRHNLSIHLRIHTGEKPFQCEICSKQFATLGNFQSHKKIHTGVKDQVCPVCNKAFFNSGDLSKHMVTHTGIKNHHCDICGKGFYRIRDMNSHKNKVHGAKPLNEATQPSSSIAAAPPQENAPSDDSGIERRPPPMLLAAPAPRRPLQGYRDETAAPHPPLLLPHFNNPNIILGI